jgi:SP family arabinose:H+ symporter-like MFS transporter
VPHPEDAAGKPTSSGSFPRLSIQLHRDNVPTLRSDIVIRKFIFTVSHPPEASMSSDRSKATFLLAKSALTGALGGLLFGFDTVVISGAVEPLAAQYHLSAWGKGFAVTIALLGTIAGALGAGPLGQKVGSRAALRFMGVLYVISAVGCALAPGWNSFLVFRFLGGICIGGSSVLGPVYIAELSPAKWRGRLVGMFQINIVVGILLAYLSNALIALLHLGVIEWRVDLGVAVIPAILFLVLLLSAPQSSRWLVSQNRIDEALLTLTRMGSPDSRSEVDDIIASLQQDEGIGTSHLFTRKHALPIFLAISIGMFNQLTGINAILYYAPSIFAAAGFKAASANLQSVAIGAANLLATLLGISLIDKLGRKTLLLIGAVGCGLALLGVGFVYRSNAHQNLLLPLLIGFIVFFAISQGSVIWVYLSEVFPTSVRSKGQSLGSSTHWIMNALIAEAFPVVAAYSHSLPFFFFASMMVVQFVVVLTVYRETKGYSLEALQQHLH